MSAEMKLLWPDSSDKTRFYPVVDYSIMSLVPGSGLVIYPVVNYGMMFMVPSTIMDWP